MRIKAGDLQLSYEIHGTGGDWLVLCHGLGAGMRSTRTVAEKLADKYHVVIWDNRGIGESDIAPAGSDYEIATHATDLANLMEALGIPKGIVYGASWGGVVGLRFAIDYPEKTRALIVDGSSAEVNERAAQNWIKRGEMYLKDGPASLRNAPGGINDGNRAVPAASPPAPAAGTPPAGPAADPRAYYETCRAVASLYEHPMNDDLPRIKAPTLAIVGEDDQTAGVGGTVKMSRLIPNAKLVIVPKAGHVVATRDFNAFRVELEELAARVR